MFMRLLERMGYTKEEASWILYDVGNSAQVLTTCTVIFPLLIAYITPAIPAYMSAGPIRSMGCCWR